MGQLDGGREPIQASFFIEKGVVNVDTGYNTDDVSGGTDSHNYFDRGVNPIGALVHTTAGTSSLQWLQSGSAASGSPASADYLIERTGQRFALMPKGKAAYHAGKSRATIQGREYRGDALSAILIGIEVEQLEPQVWTYEQLDSFAELLTQLSVVYSWRWPYTILGHYEVALPEGRRSDPQGLDWGQLMGRLYARSLQAHTPGL